MSEADSSSDLSEISAGEDEEEVLDESKHALLLRSITALDGKIKSSSQRREAVSMSEHHAPSSKDHVKLHQLIGALEHSSGHKELKKQINKVKKKAKVLPVPLPKPEQQRLHRGLAYESVTEEISKWQPVVQKNRIAEKLIFPLDKPDIQILSSPDEVIKRIQPKTDLEIEVAALLGEHKIDAERVLTPAEERALKAMSLEEARRRRAELQKYRALLSYKEAKARRQNKIKSKKYRRILRKEQLKKEKKALEELEKTDPELYMKKLNELDANRMKERISLKHRGGSKFAKKQLIYNKFSDKSRDAVQEMLQKSRELSKKVVMEMDSSDAEASDGGEIEVKEAEKQSSNPWMASASKKVKISNSSLYSKPAAIQKEQKPISDSGKEVDLSKDESTKCDTDDVNHINVDVLFDELEMKNTKTVRQMKHLKASDVECHESEEENEPNIDEELTVQRSNRSTIRMSLKRKQSLKDFEDQQHDTKAESLASDDENVEVKPKIKCLPTTKGRDEKPKSDGVISIDPNKFITLGSQSQEKLLADGEEQDEDQSLSIAQAFASDDVVQEFSEEKNAIEERDKPKDVNLVLPGWGEWTGEGIEVPKRKQKRFTLKPPPSAPRKDRDLDNVIISEVKDTAVAKHQVSELPFPFINPKQFESSIRQPIGKTWNPETAYKKLIEPKKITRIGTVISPMDKSQVEKFMKNCELKPAKKRNK